MPLNIEGYEIQSRDVRMYEQTNIVLAGLVLHLNASIFNTVTYGTTWFDLSGKENSGTMTNGPTYNSANGGSVVFDAVDDYILFGSNGINDFTSGITLEAWVNMTVTGTNWTRIFDFGAGQDADNLLLCQYSTGNELAFYIIVGSTQYSLYTSSSAITDNTNTHFAATADGSNWYIYKNSVQIATLSSSILPANVTRSSNYIGKSNWPDPYLNGKVYDAKIYNRALSATEIAHNYNVTKGRFGL